MKWFLYPLLLPLLIVLGACSKSPVVETESEGQQQQEVKEEAQPEKPVAQAKPVKESVATKLMRRLNGEPSEEVLIDSDLWYVVEDGTVKIIQN